MALTLNRIVRACSLLGIVAVVCTSSMLGTATGQFPGGKKMLRFDFGPGAVDGGHIQVLAQTVYNEERGYGFLDGTFVSCIARGKNPVRGDFCTSDRPMIFAVKVPEGNYDVKVILGDLKQATTTTVKAESRRLMLESIETRAGEFVSRTFTVNVRNSHLPSGGQVRLKERELGVFHWDDKLTLEFSGQRPAVCAVEIRKNDSAITVFLAGDSTVTDQTREPWAAWGQMLPRFFREGVAIANHAESGETLKAFINEGRLEKVLSLIKSGDYLFIQFAHNDQKQNLPTYSAPFTDYKELLKKFISEAQKRGATPVLVTSMLRRRFDEQGRIVNTLDEYPEAMRQVASEERVALIDLTLMSKSFYEALGIENSKRAFVHYAPNTFPDQPTELKDDTHFNSYGAYELAKCVVEGIKENRLALVKYLVNDTSRFDPNHPDPIQGGNH